MGERMRALDWSATPLGPTEDWPQSLRSAASTCIGSRFPIVLYWGAERVVLYNDAYAEILGGKHPWALGRACKEVWAEIWDVIAPMLDGVAATGQATWSQDQLLVLERRGYPEECYFSFSFSPVRGEHGSVEGIFTAVIESTGRVLGERRLALLRQLGAQSAARTVDEACTQAMHALAGQPDVPFALVYLTRGTGAELVAATPGANAAREAAAPQHVKELAIPGGRLVVGVNPRRPLDEQQSGFLDLVAGQLATAIAGARAYEEERKRAESLAELDRAKTAFFSNVSHEFRTPLTLLLGPAEDLMARMADAPQDARAAVEMIHRNGQRLLRLVNTLLDFARIEAGRAQASYEPTDLAALTADLASSFRSACERAGLRLAVDCRAPGEAHVDREMWEKIVLNLLSNAFKFTLEGEIAVALRREADAFRLEVRDTGSGIPEAALPRMFERFHRVEGAQGRSHEGSGIGLALVQELVKLHGGTIGVASRLGEGSVFTVSIPAGSAHLPPERIRAPREAAPSAVRGGAFVDEALSWLPGGEDAPVAKPAARRVLLADDNADLRDYARRLLAEHYEVEAVADGEAALAAARGRRPDLVITDIMMPKLDGFGLIRALRADEALGDIPIIALSARAGEEARIEGLARGADDYLVKPFSARELLVRSEALLRSVRIRREAEARVRESEARYRQVLSLMPAAVYACEAPSGAITYFNEHAVRLWGRTPVLGEDAERFCACYKVWTPDGALVPPAETPMALAIREGRAFRAVEAVVERPDGSRLTAEVNIEPIRDEAGRVIGAINVFHDVTERRQQQEKLRESERRVAAEAEALARLQAASSRLWQAKTLAEGLEGMLAATIELLGADMGNIQILDGTVLKIAAQHGFRRDFLDFFREVTTEDDSACGRTLRSGERVVIEDVETDPPYAPLREVARAAGYRGVQSTPLIARDARPLGIISTHWTRPHRPAEQDLRRLDLYARQAADFLERCLAEERLKESEQQLRLALEAGRMGAWEWDIHANRVKWSPGLEALHGLAPGSFDGTFEAFRRDIVPEDRSEVEQCIARTLATGEEHHIEYRIAPAGGAIRWVEGRGKLFRDAAGRPQRMVGVCADITARRRAEAAREEAASALARERERLEIALRTGRLGVYEWRIGDPEVWWSPETYALYGVDPASFRPTVESVNALVHPADRDELWRKTKECIERRETFMHEYRIVPPDGAERWVYNCSRVGLDAAGEPARITGVAADITERKRAEEALRDSDRRKDEFIAVLSHELRNPLAPLRSALELMRLTAPPGAGDDLAAMMERQVGQLSRLVDDLLEASRISRGHIELKREPLELGPVLRSALEIAGPLVREAGHRLELALPGEPVWVEGDAVRLAQTFANLLNNAARYTPRGGSIWVRATAERATVRISVRDTGSGLSETTRRRLFEMFARGEGSSGLGVGLALARKLVELHGGTIQARSDGPGQGAEFTVTLPLGRAPAPASAPPRLETRTKYRVLVADDNRDAAESLGELLRVLGNEVSLAYDGVEAVESARSFRPHVILLDIGMPRLDGYGAAREIRKHPEARRIKIVALTGWGQEEDRRRVREAGFDDHLVKPAELDALRRVLAEAAGDSLH